MHIVFYGPEGAGKGTQAKLLSKRLKIPILSSGDLIREAAANDKGTIGDTCRQALNNGKYVPDSEMFVLWKRRLKRPDAKGDWIMDGFPRNFSQAVFLDNKIEKYGYTVEAVIYLKLDEEESFKRLIKRGRPLYPGSNELHDSPERIRNRLAIYKKEESGVLNFYRKKGVLITIDANQAIEKVHEDILRELERVNILS